MSSFCVLESVKNACKIVSFCLQLFIYVDLWKYFGVKQKLKHKMWMFAEMLKSFECISERVLKGTCGTIPC